MSSTSVLVSTCRGGSNAFSTMMGNGEGVFVVHQPVKAGLRYGKSSRPDYDVFSEQKRKRYFPQSVIPEKIFVKETVGHTGSDCDYQVFPSKCAVKDLALTTFLMRDPTSSWNSWKKYGFGDGRVNEFVTAYLHVFRTFQWAKEQAPDRVVCLTYEHWMANAEIVAKRICAKAQIIYADKMIRDWRDVYQDPKKVWIHSGDTARIASIGHDTQIRASRGVGLGIQPMPIQIEAGEERLIESKLRPSYELASQYARADFLADRHS